MVIIPSANIRFEIPDGSRLAAIVLGERYENVQCLPLFPLHNPGSYISVQYKKEKEYEEIGIIKNLHDMPPDQKKIIEDDIAFRYFMPEITDIIKIKGRDGKDRWTVMTDKGEKEFVVQDRKENVHLTERGMVFVGDMDGCRYKVTDYRRLNDKARVELERVLM